MGLIISGSISVAVEAGDALSYPTDVLALKYAQALYGADRLVVQALNNGGVTIPSFPRPGQHLLIESGGVLGARHTILLGVEDLHSFGYENIRRFAHDVLRILAIGLPETRYLCLTLHGVGFGLDESEAFRAEIGGIMDAIEAAEYPRSLERITIVERASSRAERLSRLLEAMDDGTGAETGKRLSSRSGQSTLRQSLDDAGASSATKPHVFVAMPFAEEFSDLFHYGIQGAVNASGYLCERADLATFTGDVIRWVKERIDSAALLVADLTSANPNVYLEVGYAWGRGVPTVLLTRDAEELKFDVQGQRCLVYKNIRHLEELLRRELAGLSGSTA
ncbi:MAG TPA: hypothetical protein VFQ45_17615 [Longimicrobium sp.]|nr:hypothetical protein [Longimicrobium sp.]